MKVPAEFRAALDEFLHCVDSDMPKNEAAEQAWEMFKPWHGPDMSLENVRELEKAILLGWPSIQKTDRETLAKWMAERGAKAVKG